MKSFLSLCCFSLSMCYASHDTTFSLDRLEAFYVEYLTEEKDILAEAGLSNAAFNGNRVSPLPAPPASQTITPPAAPATIQAGYLPIVIENTSGYLDSEVYVFFEGRSPVGPSDPPGAQVFVNINTLNGEGSNLTVNSSLNGSTYSYALSELPYASGASGPRVVYLPEIDSALMLISFNDKLNIPVTSANKITNPSFVNPNDPNYNTIWDQVEIEFNTLATPPVDTDATAVSFFSIPMQIYLNQADSLSNKSGLTQSRSSLMTYLNSCFATVPSSPENLEWQKLTLYNGTTPLRVVSPGNSIAAGGFDMNYLDNRASYLYSYLADIWYGSLGFYQDNTLSIEIPGGKIYSGKASGNTITLTSGSDSVTLGPVQTGPGYTNSTTYNIFSGLNIFSNATNNADAIQVSKAFEEAIIAGIVPTTSLINASLLTTLGVFKPYYQINPNLSRFGQTKGPWYDLYSKALHACGLIYTYAYDEPLWPSVLLTSEYIYNQPNPNDNSYIGITILPSK